MSFDVVPAFSEFNHYEIPDIKLNSWVKTDPQIHKEAATAANKAFSGNCVKGGVKVDHWGGGKLDQMSGRERGIGREGGVWSGGLRSGLRTAFGPERKTPPSRDILPRGA